MATLTLQAYFAMHRFFDTNDKRIYIRDRYMQPLRPNRVDKYLGNSGKILALRLGLLAEWKTLGRNLADCIKYSDAERAIDLVRETNGLGRRDWIERLSVMFPDDSFQGCHDCSSINMLDDTYSAYDGDYRIGECCRGDYHWSDRRDQLVRNDDYEDEEEEENTSVIGDYHSSKNYLGHIPSAYDKRTTRVLVGMELEMEIGNDYERHNRAELLLENVGRYNAPDGHGYDYARCENDGSLDYGFEMVTGYTGLDVHASQLAFFKNRFYGATSHNANTCGLHVHVCKAGMSLLHASKLVLFINDPSNIALVRSLARRTESSYSQIKDKKNDRAWITDAVRVARPAGNSITDRLTAPRRKHNALRCLNSSRYEALNFNNDNTVEFRLFKGTLKYETIMACLEFSFISWFFARDTSQTQLTTDNFLRYICLENNRRDTRFLRAYLEGKGFVLPFKSKPDSRQQTATSNQPITTNEEF